MFERHDANPALSQIEVYVEVIGGGEVLADELLAAFPLNDHGLALLAQFNPLLHALCMLADTGGSIGILQLLVSRFANVMQKYRVEIPDGYRLLNLDYEYDIPKKYIFVRDTDGEQVHVSPDIETQVIDGTPSSRPPGADAASIDKPHRATKEKAARKQRSKVSDRKENRRKAKAPSRSGSVSKKKAARKRG